MVTVLPGLTDPAGGVTIVPLSPATAAGAANGSPKGKWHWKEGGRMEEERRKNGGRKNRKEGGRAGDTGSIKTALNVLACVGFPHNL